MPNRFSGAVVLFTVCLALQGVQAGDAKPKSPARKGTTEVSFKNDVLPIIKKQCLPCHAEENFNPSELSLDTYDLLMSGGKHGVPIVPGKPKESLILKKLGKEPPFGDRMPLNTKKKIESGKAKWLTGEELKTIAGWIEQGAENN